MRDFSEIAKELRLSKNLTQSQLANRMWVKKSIISAYETDARPPSLDMLIKYAREFNVSTDYLLGISDVKRDLQRQMNMNETLDEYYDLVEVYKELDPYDQEMIWSIIQVVKRTSDRRKSDNSTEISE